MQGHHNCDWNDFDSGSITYKQQQQLWVYTQPNVVVHSSHPSVFCCYCCQCLLQYHADFHQTIEWFFFSFSHNLGMCVCVCVCVLFGAVCNDSTFTGQSLKGAQHYAWPDVPNVPKFALKYSNLAIYVWDGAGPFKCCVVDVSISFLCYCCCCCCCDFAFNFRPTKSEKHVLFSDIVHTAHKHIAPTIFFGPLLFRI